MPIERKDKLLDFSKYWIFGYHIICKMSLQCDNSIRSIGYTLHQEPCNAFCSTNWFMWIPLKKESSNWYFFIFFNAAPQWFDVVGHTKKTKFYLGKNGYFFYTGLSLFVPHHPTIATTTNTHTHTKKKQKTKNKKQNKTKSWIHRRFFSSGF